MRTQGITEPSLKAMKVLLLSRKLMLTRHRLQKYTLTMLMLKKYTLTRLMLLKDMPTRLMLQIMVTT
jgi:hypothetical protein